MATSSDLEEPQYRDSSEDNSSTTVLFKSDRIYKHNIARFNHTAYDVRRGQDVINPNTTHADIMMLAHTDFAGDDPSESRHPYLYARVLGIYHANVVYTGRGSLDFNPRRVEFLWVRWFKPVGEYMSWSKRRFDSLMFHPMASDDAFGFVDPSKVLRSSYIVPAFSSGRLHDDGIGLSHWAKDAGDWKRYYVNRYVLVPFSIFQLYLIVYRFPDRDMLMRYHWGLAVGHVYSHGTQSATHMEASHSEANPQINVTEDNSSSLVEGVESPITSRSHLDDEEDDPELSLQDREDDLPDNVVSDSDGAESEDSEGEMMEALGMFDP